jgi:magnesium-transporting ATPase (P-type)
MSGCHRFLVRLLLVHGTLSNYRLARLIKYSFFKNILFCAMLFVFQVTTSLMRRCVCPAVQLWLLTSLSRPTLCGSAST